MQELDWNNLRFALALARSKSMAEAARKLKVNETTVARRIAQLQNQLSATLFERIDGNLRPTEIGQHAMKVAERVELETGSLQEILLNAKQSVIGTVRVTAVPVLLNNVLIPAISGLTGNHPGLEIELIAEARDLSIVNRQADIAIRLSRPTTELRALARKIGDLEYAVYCLESAQPHSMDWVNYDSDMQHLPQARWINDRCHKNNEETTLVTVNDADGMLACAQAGVGKAVLPVVIGDREPTLRKLNIEISLSREIWLLVHPELRQLARIREVIWWIEQTV